MKKLTMSTECLICRCRLPSIFLVSMFAWTLIPIPVFGKIVVKNIATGIDDSTGQKLSQGELDSDYTIIDYCCIVEGVANYPGSQLSAWRDQLPPTYIPDNDSPSSAWVSYAGGSPRELFAGADNDAQGEYQFKIVFDMGSFDPQLARIESARIAADNQTFEIAVNGTAVFSATVDPYAEEFGGWQSLPSTIGEGLFVPGLNSVTFRLFNQQFSPTPMGLRFEGNVVVPEPSTILLSAIAILGLVVCGWHRRRPH